MVFIIEGSGDREAQAYDNSSGSAPQLHVEYKFGGLPYSVNFIVDQSSDDADEQNSDGSVKLDQNTLYLMKGTDHSQIGLRFRNITIPSGSNITNAYLRFMSMASKSAATSVIFATDRSG